MTGGPVFVAGLERSGTSLMYALLASHPSLSMTRRTNFWRYFADQYGDLAVTGNLDACLAKMRVYKRLVALEPDFSALRAEFLAGGERTYGRLFALLEEQIAARAGRTRWGDKSLDTERYADRLMAEYPDARVLHMIRDPRDRLASVLTRWKKRRAALGAGTAAWLWSARLAERNRRRHPEGYRIVRYEDLVSDPDTEVRSVCEFIGEAYHAEMLTMSGAGRFRDNGANSSYGARPVGTISTDSVKRYESVLTSAQTAFINRVAGAEMTRFGYDPGPVALSAPERVRFNLLDLPTQSLAMAAWRGREAIGNRIGRKLPDYRIVTEPS